MQKRMLELEILSCLEKHMEEVRENRLKTGLFIRSGNALGFLIEDLCALIKTIKKPGIFVFVKEKQKILLVKHIDGKWGLPGGAMEQGEHVPNTAIRETKEETGADIEVGRLIGIFSLVKSLGQVVLFEGHIIGGEVKADGDGIETSECKFFEISEITGEMMYPAQYGFIQWALNYSWPIFGNPIPPQLQNDPELETQMLLLRTFPDLIT